MAKEDLKAIVKVQRPVATNGPENCLIYAKGRKHMTEVPLSQPLKDKLGADFKAYFNAEWNGNRWLVGDRAPAQDW